MIRFRCLVLGVLVCLGAVGVTSADPFAWDSSPDLAALAAACAPVAGTPAPSLPLLMDALVPLDELIGALPPVALFRWREQYYVRHGDRLALLSATGISRWYVAEGAGALLTAEGSNTLVQRDLKTLNVVRRVELEERILALTATAFPDLVLVSTIYELSNGASPTVQVYKLSAGTMTDIGLNALDLSINETRDALANRWAMHRISLESPDQWEETERDGLPDGWQTIEDADQSQPPGVLTFPVYRPADSLWTRAEAPVAPETDEDAFFDEEPAPETLLSALRARAVPDPDALPPGNAPGMEIVYLGYDEGPGDDLIRHRDDLDEETLSFARDYLKGGPKHLLVARDTGDYFLSTRDTGGINLDRFIYRITAGKPVISWRGFFRGDAPGFTGPSPDGRFFFFGGIRLAGEPWFQVVRAADLREFTATDQPLGWGPEADQVALDPSGKRLAAAAPDGAIWIYAIDEAKARLTVSDRIQGLPPGEEEDLHWPSKLRDLGWIDRDTLLFRVEGVCAQALSLSTRLPRWTCAEAALIGATTLLDAGLAVLWTETQALVLDARSGLPLDIQLLEPINDFYPQYAAEITPEGQLRLRAGKETWLRSLPHARTLTNEAAQALLARHAGLTVTGGQIMRLPRLPKRVGG